MDKGFGLLVFFHVNILFAKMQKGCKRIPIKRSPIPTTINLKFFPSAVCGSGVEPCALDICCVTPVKLKRLQWD